jgi:hypothetical protein
VVERRNGKDTVTCFGEFDFLEDRIAENERLAFGIAHGCVAFGVRCACAFWTGGAGNRGAWRIFRFCEAAKEIEWIGLGALGRGDGEGGVGCTVYGGGCSYDGFTGCGFENGDLGLRDGVVGRPVVKINRARDHLPAILELLRVVEY